MKNFNVPEQTGRPPSKEINKKYGTNRTHQKE